MNFNLNCYICNHFFSDITHAFNHLKKVHFVKENDAVKLRCLVSKCEKTYHTFNSLRTHIKKCSNNKVKLRNLASEVKNIGLILAMSSMIFTFNCLFSNSI